MMRMLTQQAEAAEFTVLWYKKGGNIHVTHDTIFSQVKLCLFIFYLSIG